MQPLKYIPEAKEILLNKERLRDFIQSNFVNNKHFVVIKQVMEEQTEPAQAQEEKKIVSSIFVSDQ